LNSQGKIADKPLEKKESSEFLLEYEGAQLLRNYELPVVEGKLAKNENEILTFSEQIGFPVVLKGMSREIIHKSDAGIVKVNINDKRHLLNAYREILENTNNYKTGATLEGVLVQKMVPIGIELIIGIKKDVIFGHVLILGIGGILVEVLKDFTMKIMPVTDDEVEEMIKNLKGHRILEGYRGNTGINIHYLKEIVRKLNKLVECKPEIEEMDLNPVIFHGENATICDVRILLGKEEIVNEDNKSLLQIEKMINPKSIAIIGASSDRKKNGGRLVHYLVENGYEGELYPVNPKNEQILGYKTYKKLTDVPFEIELACIIVPAEKVPAILKDCIDKEIKLAIIHSSGFAEIGDQGIKLQEEIKEIARMGNIRILGPNSMGIASPPLNIYTAFGSALESKVKPVGSIGFISQSGAMGSALLSKAWEQGAGFSRWVSVANEADLTISDFINVLAEDKLTKVISVFMEGIRDANNFNQALEKANENRKPVIIYKTGRSPEGIKAVQSHTGTIAGDDEVYTAVFEKHGVLRVNHIEELIDVARAFEIQPLPKGNNIGVITASGGACSIIADLCSQHNLVIPQLEENSETKGIIQEVIPSFGSAENPIDVTAEVLAKPEIFKMVLEAMIKDEKINGLIIMLTSNADPGALIIANAIVDVFNNFQKPIVVGRLGANSIAPNAVEFYKKQKFPVYSNPERVVSVMHNLVKYSNGC